MQKLKEAYDIKKQLVTKDISELGNILKENSNIDIIDINSDNTMYLESNCGMDSINNDIDIGIRRWLKIDQTGNCNLLLNTLPLSHNSCIVII